MVKILNVLLDNHIGGPQVRVISIAKELRKCGIETIILSHDGDGDFAEWARNENFRVYQIKLDSPQRSLLLNLRLFLKFPVSIFRIFKIIKKENVDIIHVNGLLNFQAPIAASLTHKKVVWHLIGSLYPKILVVLLMPFIKIMANKIIFVASILSEYYICNKIESSKLPFRIIYECVDVNHFNPATISKSDSNRLRDEFGINSNEYIIGSIGNVGNVKGYEYFIQGASLIKKRINNIKFLIVGDLFESENRQYYKQLKNLVISLKLEQDIIFTGKRKDIPQLLFLFDVFLLTSITEGTPIAILEAMAMEKPIVATNVGGIPEQVINGESGLIIPPRNPEAIAKSIIYLLEHPNERMIMGKMGRIRAEEKFSLQECAREHKQVYEDLFN